MPLLAELSNAQSVILQMMQTGKTQELAKCLQQYSPEVQQQALTKPIPLELQQTNPIDMVEGDTVFHAAVKLEVYEVIPVLRKVKAPMTKTNLKRLTAADTCLGDNYAEVLQRKAKTAKKLLCYLELLQPFSPKKLLGILDTVVPCRENISSLGLEFLANYFADHSEYPVDQLITFFLRVSHLGALNDYLTRRSKELSVNDFQLAWRYLLLGKISSRYFFNFLDHQPETLKKNIVKKIIAHDGFTEPKCGLTDFLHAVLFDVNPSYIRIFKRTRGLFTEQGLPLTYEAIKANGLENPPGSLNVAVEVLECSEGVSEVGNQLEPYVDLFHFGMTKGSYKLLAFEFDIQQAGYPCRFIKQHLPSKNLSTLLFMLRTYIRENLSPPVMTAKQRYIIGRHLDCIVKLAKNKLKEEGKATTHDNIKKIIQDSIKEEYNYHYDNDTRQPYPPHNINIAMLCCASGNVKLLDYVLDEKSLEARDSTNRSLLDYTLAYGQFRAYCKVKKHSSMVFNTDDVIDFIQHVDITALQTYIGRDADDRLLEFSKLCSKAFKNRDRALKLIGRAIADKSFRQNFIAIMATIRQFKFTPLGIVDAEWACWLDALVKALPEDIEFALSSYGKKHTRIMHDLKHSPAAFEPTPKMMLSQFCLKNNLRFVRIQGRTLLFEAADTPGLYTAVKLQKRGEAITALGQQYLTVIQQQDTDALVFNGEKPTAISLTNIADIILFLQKMRAEEQITETEYNDLFTLAELENRDDCQIQAYCYTASPAYFRYLHEVDNDTSYLESMTFIMHDLAEYLRHGIVCPEMADLFHHSSELSLLRSDLGFVRTLATLFNSAHIGAGSIVNPETGVAFTNFRQAGLADEKHRVNVRTEIKKKNEAFTSRFKEHFKLFSVNNIPLRITLNFIAEYHLILELCSIRRANHSEDANWDVIAEQLESAAIIFLSHFLELPTELCRELLIHPEHHLTYPRQLEHWCSKEKPYVASVAADEMPAGVYPKYTRVMVTPHLGNTSYDPEDGFVAGARGIAGGNDPVVSGDYLRHSMAFWTLGITQARAASEQALQEAGMDSMDYASNTPSEQQVSAVCNAYSFWPRDSSQQQVVKTHLALRNTGMEQPAKLKDYAEEAAARIIQDAARTLKSRRARKC